MEFLKELWDFLKVRKKWWLLPIVVVLLLVGALLIFAASAPAVAPFVYTLF
jgi:flagellar biosynthesis/type III secretory pathway M-ring protein FliF/YscJ